jgi:hypothetical protein
MTQFWHPTGIAGPAAWIASSLRQTRQGPGGLLRRDHMLLNAPGGPGASWYGNAHDAISGLIYASLVLA